MKYMQTCCMISDLYNIRLICEQSEDYRQWHAWQYDSDADHAEHGFAQAGTPREA